MTSRLQSNLKTKRLKRWGEIASFGSLGRRVKRFGLTSQSTQFMMISKTCTSAAYLLSVNVKTRYSFSQIKLAKWTRFSLDSIYFLLRSKTNSSLTTTKLRSAKPTLNTKTSKSSKTTLLWFRAKSKNRLLTLMRLSRHRQRHLKGKCSRTSAELSTIFRVKAQPLSSKTWRC
jgi:hypothetical protein